MHVHPNVAPPRPRAGDQAARVHWRRATGTGADTGTLARGDSDARRPELRPLGRVHGRAPRRGRARAGPQPSQRRGAGRPAGGLGDRAVGAVTGVLGRTGRARRVDRPRSPRAPRHGGLRRRRGHQLPGAAHRRHRLGRPRRRPRPGDRADQRPAGVPRLRRLGARPARGGDRVRLVDRRRLRVLRRLHQRSRKTSGGASCAANQADSAGSPKPPTISTWN